MQEPLLITLKDVVDFLREQGVPHALIGGLAVSLRGQPRVTADVDLVIDADVDRGLQLIAALEGSKFKPLFDDVAEVVQKAFILPIRHRVTNVKVDLALGLSGFEQQAIARAAVLDVTGKDVPIATIEDLLIMKTLAGRPQDDQDLRGLLLAEGKNIDWQYCLKVANELGAVLGIDLFDRLSEIRTKYDVGEKKT